MGALLVNNYKWPYYDYFGFRIKDKSHKIQKIMAKNQNKGSFLLCVFLHLVIRFIMIVKNKVF